MFVLFFFFKRKTAYDIRLSFVGSGMCIRDSIHHHCSVGCVTFRHSHKSPNLAQVPSDPEYRALFKASPGMVLAAADLAGIELRLLSHYLARYDGGRYASILLDGDINQVNGDKVGVPKSQIKRKN